MIKGEEVVINGDGETSRDFCYVDNAVQANILPSVAPRAVKKSVVNIAVGDKTTLNSLFSAIKSALKNSQLSISIEPVYREFRAGDVRHSQAAIDKAQQLLGYQPTMK